jgi:hypothetical protein
MPSWQSRNWVRSVGLEIGLAITWNRLNGLRDISKRLRKNPDFGRDPKSTLISVFGSYLGECVVRIYGGEWRFYQEDGWGVLLSEGNVAFPFSKVQKLFRNGLEGGDSILNFVTIIGHFQKEGWPSGKKK